MSHRSYIVFAALFVSACRSAEPAPAPSVFAAPSDSSKNPWTHLDFNNDKERFQFAIVTDRTGGHRPGVFEDAIGKLNLLQPEFVMSVGDLIEGYTEDKAELDRQWNEFQSFTAKLSMPFFYVPGNHDLSNLTEVEKWKERFGRLYFHFVYQGVLFLGLDSDDPPDTHISDEQVAYVKKALEDNPKVRWTLLFLHKPLWVIEERRAEANRSGREPQKDTGWPKIEALLQNRRYTVFAGHFHRYAKYLRHDRRYFVLATTGGISELRGPAFGEFDHVVWVTMGGDGPIVANLTLGGIWDENVSTEKSQAMMASLEQSVKIGPLLLGLREGTFLRGTVPIKLTNDADEPLRFLGKFRHNDWLDPDPSSIDETIPPNSVKQIELKLRARKPGKVPEQSSLTLETTESFAAPSGPKLEMQRVHTIAAERVLPIARSAVPVVVDGNLAEWKALPFACVSPKQVLRDARDWMGPDDTSFRFSVSYDDNNLYLAVQTTDERVVTVPHKEPWDQDGVEIRLDARPDPERSQERDDDPKHFLYVVAAPGDRADATLVYQREKLPSGVEIACIKTPRGHATELAVPTSYLDKMQGGPWKRIRLNVAVNDLDEAGGAVSQIWWRPNWGTPENYAGSGTFERTP